ncbi:hypothetical protein GCM10009633_17510 [Janibacter melonis]|uniref:hypothetical protein n=1 Tax=Janibacter melonis TaxID=262209 RepID=UPI001E2A1BAB|nr:hypothetical protein [Janibacter melonis]MCB5991954.1 hypothetical protein [Janibacter melonis]
MTVLARARRGRTLRALPLSIGLVVLGACGGDVQESDDGARLVTGRLGSMNDALKTFTVTGLDDQGCVTDATNASVLDRVEQTCGADVAVVVNSW